MRISPKASLGVQPEREIDVLRRARALVSERLPPGWMIHLGERRTRLGSAIAGTAEGVPRGGLACAEAGG